MISGIEKRKKCCILLYNRYFGRLAQLVRASRLHRECRGFESLIAHHLQILKSSASMIGLFVFIVICGCTARIYSK